MENELNNYILRQASAKNGPSLEQSNLLRLPEFIIVWIENNSSDFFTVWDENGIGIFFSNAIERVLGYKPHELVGRSYLELFVDEDANYVRKEFVRESFKNQTFQLRLKNFDQKLIWCECKISKLVDPMNGNVYYVSTIRDMTEKKEVEEMMIRSEKMSIAGQLAAGIAHEIRNPLTSIKGFLQLLQAGVNRKDVYYKIMIDEIEKMETITSELLFISKPLTDNKQEESLSQMIKDVLELLRPQAKLKNITLDVLGEEPSIYCDKSQIKQVFINIIKNAIEAMEEPGSITVTIRLEDDEVIIDIADEGPGIPEEVIHKLGEPFFTTKQHGTGLGLMITKQLLERHQANLEILQNEMKGSTFRIRLPL
ncbi:ATP-binding protein [Ornithinibacillus bavariensis]|uniref:ATP-binding protein n=1 Tax=Ornithinibacillus bavariensis TaxID=545502 RepID=UPI000EE0C598|nr:PAS domain-containing sensor histidine kinase [Ornithinibacillus sp.]